MDPVSKGIGVMDLVPKVNHDQGESTEKNRNMGLEEDFQGIMPTC